MTLIKNTAITHQNQDYNLSRASTSTLLQQHDDTLPELFSRTYDHFETRLDHSIGAMWCYMRPQGMPIVTRGLLSELDGIQKSVQSVFPSKQHTPDRPLSYFVFASRTPGIFNLGGDLARFAECVRSGDRATIHNYARACVDIIFENTNALHLPIITMALVQGDALGGGFETALSFDMIVAERSAKFCLPEIIFNLFPGMGAFSFLSRKLDAARAQRLITSGDMLTAEQLYEMGVVDILAEDGEGEAAITRYMQKNLARHSGLYAINQTKRAVNPISLGELQDVVDLWTSAVFRLSDTDLRKMERLASAQSKRMARTGGARPEHNK